MHSFHGHPNSWNLHKLPFQLKLTWNSSIYNIIHWFNGLMGQTTRQPSVWCSKYYFFLIKSCKIICKNPFYFFMKIKSFQCPKPIRNYEKNTWNVRRLDELFVPWAQRTSVLYCRLTNFWYRATSQQYRFQNWNLGWVFCNSSIQAWQNYCIFL